MLACLALCLSLGMASGSHFSYPESADNGWAGVCATGAMQSPIDLDPNMAATVHSPITYKNYFNGHFNKHYMGLMKYGENTVSWYINHKHHSKLHGGNNWRTHSPSIRDGPYGGLTHSHAYYFWNLNFHWGEVGQATKGSEHTVGGKSYPLEMHMVHVEDRFIKPDGTVDFASAKANSHGIAILSVLFHVNPNKVQNAQPLQKVDDKAWEFHYHKDGHARSITEKMDDEDDYFHEVNMRSLHYGVNQIKEARLKNRDLDEAETKLKLNVGAFIRKAIRNGADKSMSTYWTYKGSLTTPGCNEAVTWTVFQRALPIAQVQANAFASLHPNNFRGVKTATPAQNVQYLIHKPAGQ